ncbi:TPA: hypothetical protein ACHSYE_004815, partial [Klebsiella pneumoniae]
MSNLPETLAWESAIHQLEESDRAKAGPGGVLNIPPTQLANRTAWLRAQIESIRDYRENTFYITDGDPDGTIAGLSATAFGEIFRVSQGPDAEFSFIYYLNKNGVALAVARLPGSASIEELKTQINYDTVQILKTSCDEEGNVYLLLDEFGELFIASLGPVSVQEKFRKLDALIRKDRASNLHEFHDKNANVPAFIDELGDLYITGIGSFSVAQKIRAIESSIINNDEQDIAHQYDFNGRLISFQDAYGELFVPGLDKSVQESIKGIRENYQRDRAPHIRRLTDAQNRALEFTDEDGSYYLKG